MKVNIILLLNTELHNADIPILDNLLMTIRWNIKTWYFVRAKWFANNESPQFAHTNIFIER